MKQLRVPAYALPFVTRAFRGGRLRRFALLSALLAAATVLLGAYFALGDGRFEQEVRVELGHEEREWEQRRQNFDVATRDEWDHNAYASSASKLRAMRAKDRASFLSQAELGYEQETAIGNTPLSGEVFEAYQHALSAVNTPTFDRGHSLLRQRAASMLNLPIPATNGAITDGRVHEFAWSSHTEVERLQNIVDHDLIPAVHAYSSPLGLSGAVRFVGGIAAMLLSLLLLVLAPLFVAVRQASEVHENTLQPLTGSALTPSELARGLRAGPLAVVAVFALPLMGIVELSALAVGTPLRALLFLAVVGAGAYGLSAMTQLLGQIVGARRTPGIVGVSLMFAMGAAWLMGTAIGFNASQEVGTLIGAMPQSAAAYVQIWALGLSTHLTPYGSVVASLLYDAFAWVVIGAVASRVLAHRIGGLEGPALSRSWAFGAGTVAAVLACVASLGVLRGHVSGEDRQLFYFVGLLSLAVPYGMLLMTRVPLKEAPPSLRNLPVGPLLAEIFGLAFVHMVVTSLFVGPSAFSLLASPVALFYWVWAVAVVGLVAIRTAALPVAKVTTHLWIAFCGLSVLVAGGHVVGWTLNRGGLNQFDDVLALAQVSPLLGLVQALCLVLVPYVCVKMLRDKFASLRS